MSWLRARKTTGIGQRAARYRPRLDVLEDRTLPSTFTVLNLADSGAGSLRQAVLDANANPGPDVISVASNLSGTIALTSGQISITDDLVLDGPGANNLTVSGSNTSRAFLISSGVNVEIDDVTIADGRASDIIAMSSQGPVTAGGGILNRGGNLTLSQVTMTNNLADGQAAGFIALGGAVANLFGGTLTVSHGTFMANHAAGNYHGAGGAISNDAGSTLRADNSDFSDNQATAVLGFSSLVGHGLQGIGSGGAIEDTGGSTATLSDCTFTDNLAHGGDGSSGGRGGAAEGGALHCTGESTLVSPVISTLTVAQSDFSGNQAVGGAGGAGVSGGAGGRGGAALGGAITNVSSMVTIADNSFTDNQARAGAGGTGGAGGNGGVGGNANGGAIDQTRFDPAFSSPLMNVSDVSIWGSLALGGVGGSGGPGGNGGAGGSGVGGGLFVLRGALNMSDSRLTDNQAIGGAGGDPGASGARGGDGGRGVGGGLATAATGTAFVADSVFDSNQAMGGAAALGGNGGNGLGGAIFNNGALTLTDSTVVNNSAAAGAAGAGGSAGLGQGGGLYVDAGSVFLDQTTLDAFVNNEASTSNNDIFGPFTLI
jgi:hypothetical protein